MKKQNNKFGTYEKGIIITGIAVLIIFLILLTADGIKNMEKNNNLALSQQEVVVPPNVPVLSAGMIPVKMMEDNLIICKNDNTWYNYEAGTPAYMMLNDGVYQSELVVDMTNKKLASDSLGQVVAPEDQGSIYMWIPRFEINGEEEIKYVKEINYEDDGYEIPEMFTYKQEIETSPDFLLTGIWIEKTPLANESEVTTKIANMQGENNTYGFIANTISTKVEDSFSETWLPYSRELAPEATEGSGTVPDGIVDWSNTNRTTLKILNDKYQDPMKVKCEYNKTTGLIETTVTYSKYGINRITFEDTTELPMTNTNGIITADTSGITLEAGTYKITITDKKGTIKKLKVKVPLVYGREVLGYECDVPNVKWRLFHADDSNIYLIADDYIPYANLPTSTNGTALNKGNTNYSAYFTDILNDYTGSRWIRENTNDKAQKWLSKYLTAYPESTNNNMKAVAYMMDTNKWGEKFAGDKAEYVIGGPTLELFCVSYKVTHPDRYIECNSITENGYQVKWSDSSYVNYVSGLTKDDFKSIYIKSDCMKSEGTCVASPSAENSSYLIRARDDGYVTYGNCTATKIGFRPVVCLKSGVGLLDNGDNTYSIKETIMANIEHNEMNGTVEITVRYTENGIAKIEDENGKAISFTNENGIIKAVTPAVGGKNKFTITDNKGNKKELEVTVILPIYATLYTDGTLAFTATDRVLEGKAVANAYGDVSKIEINSFMPWYNQRTSITTVDIVDKIYPISTNSWFFACSNLSNVNNITNLDTSNTINMNSMFNACNSLTKLDVSNFNTSNVTDMAGMFNACNKLTVVDLGNFDTSNVTNMAGMFTGCNSLTELNVSNFNTSNVTSMSGMFTKCNSLIKIDVSNFDTSNVTNTAMMFQYCSSLTELDLSSFNTSNVTTMYGMFDNCSSLIKLNVSSFNTSNVTTMKYMFNNCSSLTGLDLSSFNTGNVTEMYAMFNYCRNLIKLDLSNFDTSNVTTMFSMFSNCSSLTQLDLSSFDTNKVTTMESMFNNCTNLKTIYVGESWKLASNRKTMFTGCGTSTTTRK